MKQLLAMILTIALPSSGLAQSSDAELAIILQRVRERVTRHYLDLQSLAWTDTAKQQRLEGDQTPKEKPRELVYDTIIRLQEPSPGDANGVPFYIRPVGELRTVDGKAVKKNETPKSTDPQVANVGPLLFLLTSVERLSNHTFSYGGATDLKGRKSLRIDFNVAQRTPPRVTWEDSFVFFGVRYHFQVSGVQYNKGSLWVDPETYDVLELEWSSDPFEFQRSRNSEKIKYEIGMKYHFQSMPFESPEQTIVVPLSMEFITTINKGDGDVDIYRTNHSFTNYKRFTGDAKVIATEGAAK